LRARVGERVGVVKGDGPVDRNLLPEKDTLLVGDLCREFVMRVVSEPGGVAAEVADMRKAAADVGFGGDAPRVAVILVDADAAQPDRPAVEKKLRPLPLDPAEADAVSDGVGAECQGGAIEPRGLGRPELGRPVEARRPRSAS
jgi:hypothetical protein